ncbi:MAG: hypothetical protein ACJ8M4_10510, partial [Chthoniobacterales bacterium]
FCGMGIPDCRESLDAPLTDIAFVGLTDISYSPWFLSVQLKKLPYRSVEERQGGEFVDGVCRKLQQRCCAVAAAG